MKPETLDQSLQELGATLHKYAGLEVVCTQVPMHDVIAEVQSILDFTNFSWEFGVDCPISRQDFNRLRDLVAQLRKQMEKQ